MKGLLYKELISCKSNFKVLVGMLVCFAALQIFVSLSQGAATIMFNGAICSLTMFMLCGFLGDMLFSNDEKQPWNAFVASTPGGMKEQILCKYYVILIINLICLFTQGIIDTIVVAVNGDPMASSSTVTFVLFCAEILAQAFIVPFSVRFGAVGGRSVMITILLAVVGAVGIYFLFGDISFISFDDPFSQLFRFMQSGVPMWIIAALPYASMLLYYLSYKVSEKVYRKDVENYGE